MLDGRWQMADSGATSAKRLALSWNEMGITKSDLPFVATRAKLHYNLDCWEILVSSVVNDLAAALSHVDPQTAILLERAVRDSLALANQRNKSPQSVDSLGYPLGYFESTSGSFAQETLERQPDPPPQSREAW